MEHAVIVSGIGGQGIQLMCKSLALAATRSGLHAMLAADYGGEMRGGPSQASVVIGEQPLRSLPILPGAGAVILMHNRHSEFARERLVAGGLLLLNSTIVRAKDLQLDARTVEVPVTRMARELGAPQAGGFVMIGAYAALTGAVAPEALGEAMRELLPPYRAQHVESNLNAIRIGAESVHDHAAEVS